MHIVASFHDPVAAQQLVGYLRRHGVPAVFTGGLLDPIAALGLATRGQFQVSVDRREHVPKAKDLLRSFRAEAVALDDDWERSTEPELSLLDPALLPACPACGHQFLRPPAGGACPACHARVDLLALIVERHGPEALASCYPADPEPVIDFDEEIVREMDLPCPGCGYSLRGLAAAGVCPECGEPYDKVPGRA